MRDVISNRVEIMHIFYEAAVAAVLTQLFIILVMEHEKHKEEEKNAEWTYVPYDGDEGVDN